MKPMQALHNPQHISHLKLLKTNRTLLTPIEDVMRKAPLHRRHRTDLLGRQSLMPGYLRKEGTLIIGLIDALLIQHEMLSAIALFFLLICLFFSYLYRYISFLLVTIAVIELAAFGVTVLFLKFLSVLIFSPSAEVLLADHESHIVEDSHIDGYDLLKLGLLPLCFPTLSLGILLRVTILKEPHD